MRSIKLPIATYIVLLWSCMISVSAGQAGSGSEDQITVVPDHQDADRVIRSLESAKIIPQVVDGFKPSYLIEVGWGNEVQVDLGNTLRPDQVADFHKMHIALRHVSGSEPGAFPSNAIMVLTDPDARSYENPDWSEFCHMIIGIYLEVSNTKKPGQCQSNAKSTSFNASKKQSKLLIPESGARVEYSRSHQPPLREIPYEVLSYKPPSPPAGTGKHRYVLLLMVPANDTSARIHPSQPRDRKHWGYHGVRVGARIWAKENGLVIAGANFFYAQNEQQ